MSSKSKASTKPKSMVQQWIGVAREIVRIHSEYMNAIIRNTDDFQKLLTVRSRLSKLEELYDNCFFQIDHESIDHDAHVSCMQKFTEVVAKLTITCESFESQQQMLQHQTCDNQILSHDISQDMPVQDLHINNQMTYPNVSQQTAVGNQPVVRNPTHNQMSPSVAEVNQPQPQSPPHYTRQPDFQFQGFKLPEIPLPSFGGDFERWLEFRSSFSAIVADNVSVSPSVKFQYLKQALSGEALNRILNVPHGNFDLAWTLLKQRYDNPRLIADTHVAAILTPPALNSNSAPSWRNFIDHLKTNIHALESINLEVDIKSLLYMYIFTSRFDARTLRDWERHISLVAVPSMENLWSFMEAQHKVAQAVSSSTASNSKEFHKSVINNGNNAKAMHSTSKPAAQQQFNNNNRFKSNQFQKSVACLFCKETSHNVFSCPSLLKLAPSARGEAVKRKSLCFNCLKPYAFGHSCLGACRQCGRKHHTLLHEGSFNANVGNGNNAVSNSIQSSPVQPVLGSCACSTINSPSTSRSSREVDSHQTSSYQPATSTYPISDLGCSGSSHQSSAHTDPVFKASNNHIAIYSSCSAFSNNNQRSSLSIMPTAEVMVLDSTGQPVLCRALLDTGSDSCLIAGHLATRLGLPMLHKDIMIHTVSSTPVKSTVVHSVTVKSTDQSWSTTEEFLVVNKISLNLPASKLDLSEFQIPTTIKLADPHFDQPKGIDILLNVSVFASIMTGGQIKVDPCCPIIQNTRLGWIVFGKLKLSQPICSPNHANSNFVSSFEISNQLEKFWKTEELTPIAPLTAEEVKVEKHYNETTMRLEDGRFMVTLPRKDNFFTLGQSEFQARKRFSSLEKRLSTQPELKSQYVEFMREYQELNHMTLVDPPSDHEKVYYIPHHAVFKPDSTTTKLRVVFDASAKTNSGVSLNELLFKGPTVQPDLFDIVLRFRMHKIAFTADIAKMYRQVLLQSSDRNFHRIFWRDDPSLPLQQFQLNTITYGTAPAAFLATRTLNKLAELETSPDSPVYQSVHQDFYIDDCITGGPDVKTAISLAQQLILLLQSGGFELRKFMSCSSELLASIPSHLVETSVIKPVSEADGSITKALGLMWNSSLDELSIASNVSKDLQKSSFTKREILSVVASIYDPLGLVSPVVVLPKIFLQKLWLLKLDWDEKLPTDLLKEWLNIFHQLPDVPQISIPRCVLSVHANSAIELHGFSDASSTAFGACVYARSVSDNIQTRLICSKSRVAPLKILSIPKLELQAALLLARLINRVVKAFNLLGISISNVFLWSDSTTVCNWIRAIPDRKDVFVAVRVAEIQETTSFCTWNHVRTSNNPADVISRGLTPAELAKNNLWWHGPSWLAKPSDHWDSFSSNVAVSNVANIAIVNEVSVSVFSKLFSRLSNPFKLIRVVAYSLRFIHNVRHSSTRCFGELSVAEIQEAELHVLKIVQQESFGPELHQLRAKTELDSRNNLHSLSPFLHVDNLLRVGGRLVHADVPFDFQHQILLPCKHKFTKALVIATHQRLCHAGVQATMASLRQRFWIPSTRRVVKSILRSCVKCFRFSHVKAEQIMGQLPAVRVNIGSPFLNVGVDYMGPLTLRLGGPKSRTFAKAHIALFVCMVTRAVHLEVVTELSTKAFLAALTRFVSIRGIPNSIYSDNGTAFAGANSELQELYKFLADSQNQRVLQTAATSWRIQWNFIPPRAPHFGGLWERSIKSFKSIFKIITINQILNFEEMYTLSAQIGAILNSRPIVPLSEDPHDLAYLSPGHFLIGRPLNALPTKQPKTNHINHLARWQRIADLNRQLWDRWSQEYLVTLQQKQKWTSSSDNIVVGTLVLLKDPGAPPAVWKLGRITEVIKGVDNKVRVVMVFTEAGTYKRAISSIAPLPLDEESESIASI